MTGKIKNALVPEAIIYTELELPSVPPLDEQSLELLRKNIGLRVQGEPVEISEGYSIPSLMAVFDVVHKISPEAVLRLKTGERVLLFDHQNVPVIRDRNILAGFVEISKLKYRKEKQRFIRGLTINFEDIWRDTMRGDNYLGAIKKSLRKILITIKPAMITTFVGKAPVLLFLLVQHQLQGKTGEIWYQENSLSTAIRITKNL